MTPSTERVKQIKNARCLEQQIEALTDVQLVDAFEFEVGEGNPLIDARDECRAELLSRLSGVEEMRAKLKSIAERCRKMAPSAIGFTEGELYALARDIEGSLNEYV